MRRYALSAAVLFVAFPVFAQDRPYNQAYAISDGGGLGVAYWSGSVAETEAKAIEFCGGAANGCRIVMTSRADCVAMSESRTAAGYWFWVANTFVDNAYARSSELNHIEQIVLGWCNESDAPDGTCVIRHSDCMNYVTNLN